MTAKPVVVTIGWLGLACGIVGCLVAASGCTVTGGVVDKDGQWVQGMKLEVTADPDVKQAAFDYLDVMGTRYRFAQACLEEHEPADCTDVMGFIEAFRDAGGETESD